MLVAVISLQVHMLSRQYPADISFSYLIGFLERLTLLVLKCREVEMVLRSELYMRISML